MRMTITGIETESELEHDHYRRTLALFARAIGRSAVAFAVTFAMATSLASLLETMSDAEVEHLASAAHLATFLGTDLTVFTVLPLAVLAWAMVPLVDSLWKMVQMIRWALEEDVVEYRTDREVDG